MQTVDFDKFLFLKFLLSIDGIGPSRIINLLGKFKNLDNILHANLTELTGVDLISDTLARNIIHSRGKIEEIRIYSENELKQAESNQVKIVLFSDDSYPELLRKIYYPPMILYVIGELPISDNIAVVGTRQPTDYGKKYCDVITKDLAGNNITIVSGLARGIDSIAHKAALERNSKTIAVIGSGIDVIYPPENEKLFNQIAANGAVVSEFSFGTKPDASNFPKRNRIISGLSLGTLVIETKVNGGAMQTAAHAIDQNREVFALPGNVSSKSSEGTNLLIQRSEAKLITNAEDILVELKLKISPKTKANIPQAAQEINLFEEKILEAIKNKPLHIDVIAEATNLATSDCLINLLALEFKGLVNQLPGKVFQIND